MPLAVRSRSAPLIARIIRTVSGSGRSKEYRSWFIGKLVSSRSFYRPRITPSISSTTSSAERSEVSIGW